MPTMKPGDVVIMGIEGGETIVDGPAIARPKPAHKSVAAREVIERAGATLVLLPPYSPGFNLIEMVFSKLKSIMRKAAGRTIEALWATVGNAIDAFTPTECANFFRAAEYGPD